MSQEISIIEVDLTDAAVSAVVSHMNDAVEAVNLAGCGCGCACTCGCGCGCASSVTGLK